MFHLKIEKLDSYLFVLVQIVVFLEMPFQLFKLLKVVSMHLLLVLIGRSGRDTFQLLNVVMFGHLVMVVIAIFDRCRGAPVFKEPDLAICRS